MRRQTAPQGRPAAGPTEPAGLRPLLPALAMLAASVALLIGLAVRTPGAGSQVALLFRPGMDAGRAIASLAEVDARLVRTGGFDNVVVAYFGRAVGWSELRAIGVLLPLDPIVAGGCAGAS